MSREEVLEKWGILYLHFFNQIRCVKLMAVRCQALAKGKPAMNEAEPKTSGLIVAAGLSSRMGAFKPMLPLGDATIIRWVITKLRTVGCHPIVLVTGHQSEALSAHVADLGVVTVHNPDYADSDMFFSVRLGLAALPPDTGQCFFTPGDVPLFAQQTLLCMMQALKKSKKNVVVPVHEGRGGHPVLIRGSTIARLLAYTGPMGMKGALSSLGNETIHLSVQDAAINMDVDRPEDYQRLREFLSRCSRTPSSF
jgi:CTP:molybdopterin cytidylyltransferase MocA